MRGEAMSDLARTLDQNYRNRKDLTEVVETVTIDKPIQTVFDAVTTSYIWVSCYPETVAVGGISKRPFRKGDLVLEKFMFAGRIYCMFQYEVAEYDAPGHILFHGHIVQMDTRYERLLGKHLAKMGGSFEYFLKEEGGKTTWERRVLLFHSGGLMTKLVFKCFLRTILSSQRKGARIYVDNVKTFLESGEYAKELWNGSF